MKTVTIMIGNSDDKLTQKDWVEYIEAVRSYIHGLTSKVHFDGCTAADHPTQRACFVAEVSDAEAVKAAVTKIKLAYGVAAAVVIAGDTEYV